MRHDDAYEGVGQASDGVAIASRPEQTTENVAQLWHIYPPYAYGPESAPVGARALCGWVKRSAPGRKLPRTQAGLDACAVCCSLDGRR